MNQHQAWNQEYSNAQGVPTSTRTSPSSAVKRLLDYIAQHRLEVGKEGNSIPLELFTAESMIDAYELLFD